MTCTIASAGKESNFILKNEYELPYPEIKLKLCEKIWQLYCRGYDSFWLDCEQGVSLWSAEIIIALKKYNNIELNVAMPYEEQSTNWAEDIRERFFHIHEQADNVHIISNYYTKECYKYADEYMIHYSGLLLIVGNDKFDQLEKKYQEKYSIKTETLDIV